MGFRVFIAIIVFGWSGALSAAPNLCPDSLRVFGQSPSKLDIQLERVITSMITDWNRPLSFLPNTFQKPRFLKVSMRVGSAFSFREKTRIAHWQKEILGQLSWKPNYWEMRQSTKNSLAFLISSWNARRPINNLKALVAYSFLHPLVDGPLDRREVSLDSIERIRRKISGEPIQALNLFERDVFVLLDIIQEAFPFQQHPELKWLFLTILNSQLESVEIQRSSVSTNDALLAAVFKKGGLCLAIGNYISHGYLSEQEFIYLVRQGGVLQLLDDLGDVIQDRREGTRTIFTEDFGAHNSAEVFKRLIYIQEIIYKDLPPEISYLSEISLASFWFFVGRVARFPEDEIRPLREADPSLYWSARLVFELSYRLHLRAYRRNFSRLHSEISGFTPEYFQRP